LPSTAYGHVANKSPESASSIRISHVDRVVSSAVIGVDSRIRSRPFQR
jgi:hypothetical protein